MMKDFGAHAHRLRYGTGIHRHDHKFLDVDWIVRMGAAIDDVHQDRKSTRLNSSHKPISYVVFCLKKKNNNTPLFRFDFL